MVFSRTLLSHMLDTPEGKVNVLQDPLDLSAREINILTLLAEGFTDQEIADQLFCNKRRIENERQAMLDQSGYRNIIALVRLALLHQLI